MLGVFKSVQNLFLKLFADAVQAAAMADLDTVFVELLQPVAQRRSQQAHKPRHLFDGTGPVFGGKGVDGQDFDAEFDRGLEDRLDIIDAGAMADKSKQTSFRGPAAIPVHDDPYMVGNPGERGESVFDQVIRALPDCIGTTQWNTDSLSVR